MSHNFKFYDGDFRNNLFIFLDYSLNSILYQRGVFPEESFIPTQHYGLTMYMSKMPEIQKYISEILPQLKGMN